MEAWEREKVSLNKVEDRVQVLGGVCLDDSRNRIGVEAVCHIHLSAVDELRKQDFIIDLDGDLGQWSNGEEPKR